MTSRTEAVTRAYNTVTDADFTPESIQAALERLYDDAARAGSSAPVRLAQTVLTGAWYVVRGAEPGPGTTVTARWKAPIENSDELDRLKNAHDWLSAVLEASGKTRDELADMLGLDVRRVGL